MSQTKTNVYQYFLAINSCRVNVNKTPLWPPAIEEAKGSTFHLHEKLMSLSGGIRGYININSSLRNIQVCVNDDRMISTV